MLKQKAVHLVGGVLFVAMVLGGCGDDDGGTDNNNNNDVVQQDSGVDAGPDAATGDSVQILILDGTDPDNVGEDATPVPLADAMLAFDLPGGERVERTSDAEGVVTIYGIDWTQGTAAMTAYKEGYALLSAVGMVEGDFVDGGNDYVLYINGMVGIYLHQLSVPEATVEVVGSATHFQDAAHELEVSVLGSTISDQWSGTANGHFTITAPQGEPFTLLGVEQTDHGVLPSGQGSDRTIHQVLAMDVLPLTQPTVSVELDFVAHGLPVYTEDASFVLPTRSDSPLRDGQGYLFVGGMGSNYPFGWGTPVDISADGNSMEGTVTWVEPPAITEPYLFYMVYEMGARSVILQDGYPQPQTGPYDPPLYDLPRWTTPADTFTQHPFHDLIEWELFDDWPVINLIIKRSSLEIWRVAMPSNATSVAIPQPPSNVDTNTVLGPTFQAQLRGGYFLPDADHFDRFVESEIIRLAR